ncbi:DUF3168 domain-containing protein [Paenibacillus sp. FSL L8-0708]|uniref:DUF3168 domain-containing protein n=1 Tax=Paenibacillus sp. FSL L8-0708 TaxID=2975311 RepID=UPI0030FCC69E
MIGLEFEDALSFELESMNGFRDKVYPAFAPGTPVPYLVYISSEGVRVKTLEGFTRRRRIEVELNIVTKLYREMKEFSKVAIDKLISMEGRVIGEDGPFIQELTYEKPVEIYEEGPKLYRCLIDFTVHI